MHFYIYISVGAIAMGSEFYFQSTD